MTLTVTETEFNDVIIIEPKKYPDTRGFFQETFHKQKYADIGLEKPFVQDNFSSSQKGVIRGLHYQLKRPQAKLIFVVTGEILDVAVDIRLGSPTFSKFFAVNLSEENGKQLYIPEGFAHGFCVLSDVAKVIYKCTDFYTPGDDYGILWSDPDIGINWANPLPIISQKDNLLPSLNKTSPKYLPVYHEY